MSAWPFDTHRAAELAFLQHYVVEVPGVPGSEALSVVSFELVERLGEPWSVTLELTHPELLRRVDYVGKDARFTLGAQGASPRVFHGCLSQFSHVATTPDLCTYRFVLASPLARLSLVTTSRIFQQQSAPQIIAAILRRHGFTGQQFAFRLRRTYPVHAFRLQYQLSDGEYIALLMRQEGLYSYALSGAQGEVLVLADDVDHYIYTPTLTLPLRPSSGLASADEAILALHTHAQTVPQSFQVADYVPEQAWERFQAQANVASSDRTTYGQPYVYGTGHQDAAQARWAAQLRHEAAIAAQVIYQGESSSAQLACARVVQTDALLPDAPHGLVVTAVVHAGARDRPYRNTFQAIPADRRFRLPLQEASWPKMSGTLSARVTSPGDYPYAYLTEHGHYTVRFDLDGEGQYYVADLLAPIENDPDVARQMRLCAAAQGYGKAAAALAINFKNKKDFAMAVEIFQKGVAAGDSMCASFLEEAFKNPPQSDRLYYLAAPYDLERSNRYRLIWKFLDTNESRNPKIPDIDKIVPLPPTPLPEWDGTFQWQKDQEKIAPKPSDELIQRLARDKHLDPATGLPLPTPR